MMVLLFFYYSIWIIFRTGTRNVASIGGNGISEFLVRQIGIDLQDYHSNAQVIM